MLAKGLTTNADASTELHQLYMSLLGAVAYMALTRPDAVAYISALQRFNHAPKVIHVKRLNALTRWLQRHPKGLHYPQLSGSDKKAARWTSQIQYHMKVSSDAAFKNDEEKGTRRARCCFYLRAW